MSTETLDVASRFVLHLLDTAVIDREQLQEISTLDASSALNKLWQNSSVVQETLAAAVANYLHLTYIPSTKMQVTDEATQLLAHLTNEAQSVLPLQRIDGALQVAVSNPFDLDLRERLESVIGETVEIVVASPSAVAQMLRDTEGSVSHLDFVRVSLNQAAQQYDVESAEADDINEASAPVVRLVNTLLREAVAKRASDIHIEHQSGCTVIRYRIDGVLRQAVSPLGKHLHRPLISRIKVMAELDITEHNIPQDGRFREKFDRGDVDFRVSILPGMEREDAVIRVLDRQAIPGKGGEFSFSHIGIEAELHHELKRLILNPAGMVIVAGPTGSGKTTTLYAVLNELDQEQGKTITIEDPVEYCLPGILQIPVNNKKKLTFSSGLRSILRHDPDRIMVGEIRDRETAEIAVQSALTGHLLFTTVHANTALDVINRFSHMGISPEEFLPSLSCIFSQRLVRLTCTKCRVHAEPDDELLGDLGLCRSDIADFEYYEGQGCDSCGGTGYDGRSVVAELLKITPAVAEKLSKGHTVTEVRLAAEADGMRTMMSNALAKVKSGTTTFREIRRVLGTV